MPETEEEQPATAPASAAPSSTTAPTTTAAAAATTAATTTTAPPTTAADSKDKKSNKKKKRSWLPLESNPEVLSSYARALGAPAAASTFADVYGLDEELLGMVPGPVLALLLLFPITKSYEDKRVAQEKELLLEWKNKEQQQQQQEKQEKQEGEEGGDGKEGDKAAAATSGGLPYFTRQTIGNACGTVGLIHSFASIGNKVAVASSSSSEGGGKGGGSQQQQQQQHERGVFAPGSFFDKFFEATRAMTPDERAAFLEADDEDEEDEGGEGDGGTQKSSQKTGGGDMDRETRAALAASIDAAHAAAAVKGDTRPPGEDEAVDLHFVAFVEAGGRLWELDGRKVAPVDHGETSKETLLKDAAAVIGREFVRSETAEGSLSFNLLALVGGKADE